MPMLARQTTAEERPFRSVGIGVLQDFLGEKFGVVPGAFTDGADVSGRMYDMHGAVASRNQQAAKKVSRLASTADASGGGVRRGHSGKRFGKISSSQADEDPVGVGVAEIDMQALTAEFDSVAAALRTLMSDAPSQQMAVKSVKEQTAVDEDETEGTVDEFRKRMLRYRYVRKIEEPPPPLGSLEDFPPEAKRGTDKIERNKSTCSLSWGRGTRSRAMQRNQANAERTGLARQRREEFEAYYIERMEKQLADDEARHPTPRAKMELKGRLQDLAKLRDSRMAEAQQRREEHEEKRREKILADLAGKQARSAGLSANMSPRRACAVDAAHNSPTSAGTANTAQQQSQALAQHASDGATAADGDVPAVGEDPKVASVFELFSWDDLEEEEEEAEAALEAKEDGETSSAPPSPANAASTETTNAPRSASVAPVAPAGTGIVFDAPPALEPEATANGGGGVGGDGDGPIADAESILE